MCVCVWVGVCGCVGGCGWVVNVAPTVEQTANTHPIAIKVWILKVALSTCKF